MPVRARRSFMHSFAKTSAVRISLPGALYTKPLKIDVTFYCRKCYGMATGKTCPHDPKYHIAISGTEQRKMLSSNAEIPPEFSRPEVVAILKEYYTGLKSKGEG